MLRVTLVLLLILGGCITGQNNLNEKPQITSEEKANSSSLNGLCFGEKCIKIERALLEKEQAQGLMFRDSLCQECGMLFVFEGEAKRKFWMKNTLIPLDMIWLNANKQIVGITKNATPCKQNPCPIYESPENTKFVLEVNSGFTGKNMIEIGDKTSFIES